MRRIITLIALLALIVTSLQAQYLDATNNSSHKQEKTKQDSFRKSGFTIRPELGFVYGRKNYSYTSHVEQEVYMFGPIANVAIGFQVGSHFFFGTIVGYEGEYNLTEYWYMTAGTEVKTNAQSILPIMADVRWYIINHKNTIVFDAQVGPTLIGRNAAIIRIGAGFAFGNFETTAGIQYYGGEWYDRKITGFNINASYRFGQVIKKWW